MLYIIFFGLSFVFWYNTTSIRYFEYTVALFLLFLGVFAVIRKHPRLLPALLMIGYEFEMVLYIPALSCPGLVTALTHIDADCTIVALYLGVTAISKVKNCQSSKSGGT